MAVGLQLRRLKALTVSHKNIPYILAHSLKAHSNKLKTGMCSSLFPELYNTSSGGGEKRYVCVHLIPQPIV